jgi:3-oxoacyl-[acyl-carrier protein] reductase
LKRDPEIHNFKFCTIHFHPAVQKIQQAQFLPAGYILFPGVHMKRLKDKVAVITGASKGIGKAIAIALAAEGAKLVLAARTAEDLEQTAKEVARQEVEVLAIGTDVRNPKDVEELAAKSEKKFGAIHILVNNAGIGRFQEVQTFPEEDFHAIIETNLYGVFYCAKAFLPGMVKRGEGHIINISSLAGKNTFAGGSAYCASKHALIAFSECMMLEVRQHNIKVTTICPGSVATDFSHPGGRDMSWALTSEDVAKSVLDVLTSSARSLISLVDLRPLKPQKR